MEFNFMSLNDDCVRFIIDACPNADLRNLRCVNPRLRALVDATVTEIDMEQRFFHIQTDILRSWKGFPNVKTLKISRLSEAAVRALFETRWTRLDTLAFQYVYDDGDFIEEAHLINPSAFESVQHLTLTGGAVNPDTLAAIVRVCPLLQSLTISRPPVQEMGLYSKDIFGALVRPGPADAPHLRKLALPVCSLAQHPLHAFFPVQWDILEELHVSFGLKDLPKGPAGVAALFGPPSRRARWPNLKVLGMRGIITDLDQVKALFDVHMPQIEVLEMSQWKVGTGMGTVMTRCVQWPNLRKLTLKWTVIEREELQSFMEVTLPRLESIELALGEGGFTVLDRNAHRWPSLLEFSCVARCTRQEIESFSSNNSWKFRFIGRGKPRILSPLRARLSGVPMEGPPFGDRHSFQLSNAYDG